MRGGSEPGQRRGGRAKGVPNKASVKRQAAVAASGLTPLEYMLQVMRDKALDLGVRMDAAKAAAPYIHPKLATIEHGNKGNQPFVVQIVGKAADL